MSLCPFVKMPESFTHLLQVSMQSTGNLYRELPIYFHEAPSLKALVENSLKDFDKDTRIDFFLKSMGWHGLRDRIASLYVYRAIHGEYPDSSMLNLVDELLVFEDKVKSYTIGNYSRGFMLAFYLKLALIQKSKEADKTDAVVVVDQEIFDILQLADSKVIKVDYLILSLVYLKKSLGYKVLKEHLAKGGNYTELYSLMNVDDRALMIENLLSYGASIGDDDIFINRIV